MRKPLLFFITLLLLVEPFIVDGSGADIDCVGTVNRVVDGDTIYVYVENVFDKKFENFLHKDIKVRFADINAPELSTYEGVEAKRFLDSLLRNYSYKVYLDIDDVYVYGKYGRVIAVIYVKYNSTHLLNIDLYMVREGYAEVTDYENSFSPYDWSLYVEYTEQPERGVNTHSSRETSRDNTTSPYPGGNELYGKILVIALIVVSSIMVWFIIRDKVRPG